MSILGQICLEDTKKRKLFRLFYCLFGFFKNKYSYLPGSVTRIKMDLFNLSPQVCFSNRLWSYAFTGLLVVIFMFYFHFLPSPLLLIIDFF